MKQDNRGLTLIELIIAVTVSTIILGATIIFISNSLRSYQSATKAIDLQMESHVMMEQLGVWIMEGNRIEMANGVTVKYIMADGSTVSKSANNVLVIYQIPCTPDISSLSASLTRNDKASKRLVWMYDNKLYTTVIDNIENFDDDETTVVPESDDTDKFIDEWGNCICEYIEAFDPIWYSDKDTVEINVTLKAGAQEYKLKNKFKVRNEILDPPSPTP